MKLGMISVRSGGVILMAKAAGEKQEIIKMMVTIGNHTRAYLICRSDNVMLTPVEKKPFVISADRVNRPKILITRGHEARSDSTNTSELVAAISNVVQSPGVGGRSACLKLFPGARNTTPKEIKDPKRHAITRGNRFLLKSVEPDTANANTVIANKLVCTTT